MLITQILPSTVAYEIIAGSVTGAVEASITYPLDYIKTRSQLLNTRPASLPGLGPWKTALNHYKTEHIGLFYKGRENLIYCIYFTLSLNDETFFIGLSALALGNIAKSGVRFTGYEIFRVNLADEKVDFSYVHRSHFGHLSNLHITILGQINCSKYIFW